MKPYPLKFRPIYKERIWGGQKLREVFGRDIPDSVKIGESWELADLPEDNSEVINGDLAGKTLREVIEEYGVEVTGKTGFELPFPLLIKILDAEDVLSVQVHPDEEACRRLGKGTPKTESWYIISAEEGAKIYKGLKEGVSREQFAEAIKEGTAAELLKAVEVSKGECHFLPAGTVHAIGKGLLIAEIQTPSDTTYRVFDWNRVDASGKGRTLHIAEAMESINFEQKPNELPVHSGPRLAESEYFTVDKYRAEAGAESGIESGQMRTLIFLSGSGQIGGEGIEAVGFGSGDTVLIPAGFEGKIRFERDCEYLVVTV